MNIGRGRIGKNRGRDWEEEREEKIDWEEEKKCIKEERNR
jgi:hypothetical protein